MKRTTIELDEKLLARAKKALGAKTTRATVEEALRRVGDQADAERSARAEAQKEFFKKLPERIDVDVLMGGEAWR